MASTAGWPRAKALGRKLTGLSHRVFRHGLDHAEHGLRVCEQKYAESQRCLLAKPAANKVSN